MKHLFGTAAMLALLLNGSSASGLSTAFTYQGQLRQSGTPVNGTCNLQFAAFDAESSGNAVGPQQQLGPFSIDNGLFTASLDLGGSVFNGGDRWLEIGVQCPPGNGPYVVLSPRQKLTATPYALFSLGIADGAVTSSKIADGAIQPGDLGFNYAASTSPGGPAADVSFPYAGSNSKGGAANDVNCTGCIAGQDLQSLGITNDKLSGLGSTAGQVLTSAGSSVSWQTPTSLALPFSGAANSAGDAFAVSNGGTGRALLATSTSTTNPALVGENASGGDGVRGRAGKFGVDGGSGVYGEHLGLGAGVTGVGLGFGVGIRAINTVSGGRAADLQGRLEVAVNSGDIAIFNATGSKRARIDSTGKGFFNGGTQMGGADIAEFVPVLGELQAGDVVEIDPRASGRFRLADSPNSTRVAGVISTEPGVSLNAKTGANEDVVGPQLALVGRVPVKVSTENGVIHPGDLLVASSTPGHAMRAPDQPLPGTVIGKSMQLVEKGTAVAEMLVMLR